MSTTTLTTEIWFGVDKKRKFFGSFAAHGHTPEEVRATLLKGAELLLEDVTTGEELEWIVDNIPNGTEIELFFVTRS